MVSNILQTQVCAAELLHLQWGGAQLMAQVVSCGLSDVGTTGESQWCVSCARTSKTAAPRHIRTYHIRTYLTPQHPMPRGQRGLDPCLRTIPVSDQNPAAKPHPCTPPCCHAVLLQQCLLPSLNTRLHHPPRLRTRCMYPSLTAMALASCNCNQYAPHTPSPVLPRCTPPPVAPW